MLPGLGEADMAAGETAERIDKDKKQADQLGLEGTPFLFVNGREVDLKLLVNPYDDLEAWLKLELELTGITPKPVAPGSATMAAASPPPTGTPKATTSSAPGAGPKR